MARASIRTRATRVSDAPEPSGPATSAPRNLKKSARLDRHSKFVSRIEKKATATTSTAAKRRRPQKKLVSTLDSLADALPDINISAEGRTELEGMVSGKKGIKSRPGAMKKKEKMLRSECERFGKNLAIIGALEEEKKKEGSKAGTWAALRGFIGATLEKKEEFIEMEQAEREKEAGKMDVEA